MYNKRSGIATTAQSCHPPARVQSTYAPLSIQQSEALDSLLRDATTGEVKWKGSLVKNQDGTLAWTNKTAPVRQYGSPFQEKSSRAFSARAR